VNGRVAFDGGRIAGELGRRGGFGTFLPARGTPATAATRVVEAA
jgi:hypothetical protein